MLFATSDVQYTHSTGLRLFKTTEKSVEEKERKMSLIGDISIPDVMLYSRATLPLIPKAIVVTYLVFFQSVALSTDHLPRTTP
jgi:hypothetical protein